MSTDYYARLEQQRGPQPSVQVLFSLAQALRLDPDEQDYLFRVAGHSAPDRHADREEIAPALLRVYERFDNAPAFILSSLGEILLQNAPATAMFGDTSALTGFERSFIFRWFAHPETSRSMYPEGDHERQGRAQVAQLRAALGAAGSGSRAEELAHVLSRRSPEFLTYWESQEVGRRFEDQKVLLHPEVGSIHVDCHTLFNEDESQVLLLLSAAPGTADAKRLEVVSARAQRVPALAVV